MIFSETERNLARDLFGRIGVATTDVRGGITRESYGAGETMALEMVAEAAHILGLHARVDTVGNLVVSIDGLWPVESTVIGSHLDSVPCGGNYDGLAGVIAGLLCVSKAKQLGEARPIIALGLRGEESAWYGIPYVGAKALFGHLTEHDLARPHRELPGVTLGERLAQLTTSHDMTLIERGERLLPTNAIREFWELHIEQGPVLASKSIPVGAVTGIRGNTRAPNARVLGKAGHSGTTPHHLREDAILIFAELMVELEAWRATAHFDGKDIVVTCGIVGTNPSRHSITTIADQVRFGLDVRSLDPTVVQNFYAYAKTYAQETVDWGELIQTPGVAIRDTTWRRVVQSCKHLGVACLEMPSGAGHETAVFAQAGIASGMVFVRNDGGSHNPHERMDIDDFMLGVEVLWETIQ